MATVSVRGRQILIGLSWLAQFALAFAFFRAGYAKMVSDPLMVQIFDLIGFGQWFRYVSGVVELSGAVLILLPRLYVLGGLWLMATMFVAILINLVVTHTNALPPNIQVHHGEPGNQHRDQVAQRGTDRTQLDLVHAFVASHQTPGFPIAAAAPLRSLHINPGA